MNIISVVSTPSKSLYNKLNNLFEGYKIIYFSELIRNNVSNKSSLWTSINNDILSGKPIKDEDICNLILEQFVENTIENYILLGFPRTVQQLEYLENLLDTEKMKYKLIGVFNKTENNITLEESFKERNDVIEVTNFDDLLALQRAITLRISVTS
ncbi:adenylate kinase family enzyme [Aquimarina sp. EL_43]|uniref:nucleoside monophosphate kinase n=1 Tax=unclassified Aquimarina TaxID=2627091 RepID=UPI0018CB6A48|nr:MULTISPECIES: nucleoside monophosphate kinase [unclassified Aquimarina]MBG6133723.1 adenylate kinase family enzyme [Aquimarina sp. EL_35]MBG6153896.1 adenylate kinase family enzyme [Aquimarina sp. EL_32]MBG6172096.1 adenylate kinase family enzyme [Aquimarina sp. EL_43]